MKKIIMCLFMVLAVSCGSKTSTIQNSEIKTAIKVDIDSINPYKMVSAPTKEIMYNVYEGLLMPKEDGTLRPAIAKEYSIDKDGKTYSFIIRDNVYFHNGEKLTIKDVIFSLNKIKELKYQKEFNNIVSINETKNPLEVSIVLKEPDSSFIYSLTTPIISEKTYDDLDKIENGTGPYFVKKYTREHKLILNKFDKYYGDKANIEVVDIDIIPNVETIFLNFISNKYNFLGSVDTKRLDDIKDKKIITYPENMLFIMGINNKKFNLELRKSIVSAIDKKQIIEKATNNYAIELKSLKTNVDKELVNDLTLDLKIPSNYKIYLDTAQVIKEQLSKHGIKVNIIPQEFATWLKDVYTDRNYDITLIALSGKLDKDSVYRRFTSDYKRNFLNYSNNEYDELIMLAKKTFDINKRDELYEKAYEILINDYASAFIMDPKIAVAMDKNITGYTTYTIPYVDFAKLKFGE
ncbi:ABC transporter substrate-binding protein [Oceanivirga salmonicida]|uniref:ABC transporter substrate-binding protein n=1 Tax=Oceanivirga salmonicida TaxID=1769291 RepID=UPI0012E31D47|nr:ABC transporter substrate-binding protein [Oceanivirga salmonicida]